MTSQPHLDAEQIAGYLDRGSDDGERTRIEAHLADCAECRRELLESEEIARSRPIRRAPVLVPLAAAAAAAAVLTIVVVPHAGRDIGGPVHREPAVVATAAPATVAPRGEVAGADTLRWSRVPSADRYRVAVYESEGALLWETVVTDTAAALPAAVHLRSGPSYYWSVRARTGWDRWVESELTWFKVKAPVP